MKGNGYVLTMSEDELGAAVMEMAQFYGWRVAHFRPARTARGWRTAMAGHIGVPDLILARGGVIIMAELKRERGRLTREQAAWAVALGENYRLWRPRDLDAIRKELR